MLRLAGNGITLQLDPTYGGRITSLHAHGLEWLAPACQHPEGGDYRGSGWDEIVPTIQACTLRDGTELQDHGDAWRLPWAVFDHEPLRMGVRLTSLPVVLERTITAIGGGLRLSYRATSDSVVPVPLLWAAHPLFVAPSGTKITASTTALVGEYPRRGERVTSPTSIDAVPNGTALKAFATGIQSAAVVRPGGEALTLTWAANLAAVGFYWDRGEFSDEPVVAIEPTTGAGDRAADLLDALPTVSAAHPLAWWIAIEC